MQSSTTAAVCCPPHQSHAIRMNFREKATFQKLNGGTLSIWRRRHSPPSSFLCVRSSLTQTKKVKNIPADRRGFDPAVLALRVEWRMATNSVNVTKPCLKRACRDASELLSELRMHFWTCLFVSKLRSCRFLLVFVPVTHWGSSLVATQERAQRW